MKRKPIVFAAFALAVALSFTLTVTVRTQNPSHTAFTATVVEQRLLGGREYERENQLHAFRSTGSRVRILQRPDPNGEIVNITWIVDVDSGKSISIHPETETITTRYVPPEQAEAKFRRPDRSCVQASDAERRTIHGFDAVKSVITPAAEPGLPQQIEEWKAPSLDCFPLVQTITQMMPDGSEHKTIRTATFVMLGEPADSLFAVPQEFVERSPAEAAAEFSRRFPGRSIADDKTVNRAESRYRLQQKR